MKIYINSRGYKQAEDYHWHEIDQQEEKPVDQPPLVEHFSYLINRENFSLLLALSGNQLLLLISALEPPTSRTDIKGRIIRNSLALVGAPSDEKKLRSIAVSALRDELAQKLEDLIEFGGSQGFKVKEVDPNKLLEQLTTIVVHNDSLNKIENTIQELSHENAKKEELAKELQQYCLPQQNSNGVLVVVTEGTSKTDLENVKVWRGLTSNFSSHLAHDRGDKIDKGFLPQLNLPQLKNALKNWGSPANYIYSSLIEKGLHRMALLFMQEYQPKSPSKNRKKDRKKDKGSSVLSLIIVLCILGLGLGSVFYAEGTWTVNLEKIINPRDRTTNHILAQDGKEINKKNPVKDYETNHQLTCEVVSFSKDWNLILTGDDNLVKKKRKIKAYMFINGNKVDNPVLTPNASPSDALLFRFSPNSSVRESTYKIVAGFDLTQTQAQDNIQADQSKDCQRKATGNPCIVCLKP